MPEPRSQEKARDRRQPAGDHNRQGPPDLYDFLLRVVGWLGRLTGDRQLEARVRQQILAQLAANTTTKTATNIPPRKPAAASRPQRQPPRPAAKTRPTYVSAVDRSSRDPGADRRIVEFLRKLLIVSAVVIPVYLALRQFGPA